MKKSFLFCALLAGIAVMTGCKKDQDVISLEAVIDRSQDTKAYFGDETRHLAYWDDNDRVYVKGETAAGTYALSNTRESFATIANVPASDVYCAIFPAHAVEKVGTPNADGTQAIIYYDPNQPYVKDGSHQRLEMPMGAVTTDKRLIFKNLCSIFRLNVTNSSGDSINVMRLTVQAFGVYLAGCAKVTLYEDINQPIDIQMDELNERTDNNVISLYAEDYDEGMESIDNDDSKSFDIVVPPFTNANYLIIEVEYTTSDDKWYYTSDTIRDPDLSYIDVPITDPATGRVIGYEYVPDPNGPSLSVARNKIITVGTTVNSTNRITCDYAYLLPGRQFNNVITTMPGFSSVHFNGQGETYLPPENLTQAQIDASTEWNGWKIVSIPHSPIKIYAHVEGTTTPTLKIRSRASLLYADKDCSHMFEGITTLTGVNWNTTATGGFQSEDVTDMSYMFAGCTSLGNVGDGSDIAYLNTTNVSTMAHMFEGCNATNIYLNNWNTHNLKDDGMVAMFKDCHNLQTVDLSSFSTPHITDLSEVFMNCPALTNLILGLEFNTEEVTNMDNMFNGCSNLATLDLSSFNTAQVTSMINLFKGCTHMATLRLDNFNMSNVTPANYANMCKNMSDDMNIYETGGPNHCTVFCPESVKTAITAKDGNENYYSGLNEAVGGNYYPNQINWPVQEIIRKVQFEVLD